MLTLLHFLNAAQSRSLCTCLSNWLGSEHLHSAPFSAKMAWMILLFVLSDTSLSASAVSVDGPSALTAVDSNLNSSNTSVNSNPAAVSEINSVVGDDSIHLNTAQEITSLI